MKKMQHCGAGFGISRATVYRYVAEGITVLAVRRPDLHEALQRARRRRLGVRHPGRQAVRL
jgi:NAD(P)-dependent dehydrogenase (short-subunit alcohol dehydrogenase family)